MTIDELEDFKGLSTEVQAIYANMGTNVKEKKK